MDGREVGEIIQAQIDETHRISRAIMSDTERDGDIWRFIAEGYYGSSEGDPSQVAGTWSAAWVLLSLIYCRGPAERWSIVAAGDYINHAIMTKNELEGGLRQLIAAGHVTANGDRFAVSPTVLRWYEGGRYQSISEDMKRVENFLLGSTST